MSSFNCEHCHAMCTDTECGYVTGCEHYPVNPKHLRQWYLLRLEKIQRELLFIWDVSIENNCPHYHQIAKTNVAIGVLSSKIKATSVDSQPAKDRAPSPELSTPPACRQSGTCSRCETGCRE